MKHYLILALCPFFCARVLAMKKEDPAHLQDKLTKEKLELDPAVHQQQELLDFFSGLSLADLDAKQLHTVYENYGKYMGEMTHNMIMAVIADDESEYEKHTEKLQGAMRDELSQTEFKDGLCKYHPESTYYKRGLILAFKKNKTLELIENKVKAKAFLDLSEDAQSRLKLYQNQITEAFLAAEATQRDLLSVNQCYSFGSNLGRSFVEALKKTILQGKSQNILRDIFGTCEEFVRNSCRPFLDRDGRLCFALYPTNQMGLGFKERLQDFDIKAFMKGYEFGGKDAKIHIKHVNAIYEISLQAFTKLSIAKSREEIIEATELMHSKPPTQ